MKLFRYQPGGFYQIRISETIFNQALKRMTEDLNGFPEDLRPSIQAARQEWKALAQAKGLDRYDSADFRATELFAIFMDALNLQMQENEVPTVISYQHRDELPAPLRKQVRDAYEGFLTRERRFLARKTGDETVVFSLFGSVTRALQQLYTGKSEDLRIFEQQVVTYVAGDSPSARKYLMRLLKKLGASHEGLRETIYAIRNEMLLAELAYKALHQDRGSP